MRLHRASMRILHIVTNAELGGAQSVVAELARGAVSKGAQAAVASQAQGPLWALLDGRVERYPLPHMVKELSPLDDFLVVWEIRRVIRRFRPDIIQLHSSKAGVLGRLCAGRLRKRTIYTVHGFDTILKAHRFFLPLERALQHFCGAVVAVSAYDRRNLAANGISRKLRVIRNGVRDWRGARPGNEAAAVAMEKARSDGGAVLCIARRAPPKRFDLFLETARALPGSVFFWIGDEAGDDAAELPANVRMLGSLPDAGAYANYADVLVLFSDYEGLPMSVLEALSCGTPVVASRVGGVPEALVGDCGEAVPNEASAATAAVTRYLPGGDRHWASSGRYREAARSRYEELFSVGAMAGGYEELYRELSDGQGA
jgi:glycosyltransferase involved in cell wall biosynthesis